MISSQYSSLFFNLGVHFIYHKIDRVKYREKIDRVIFHEKTYERPMIEIPPTAFKFEPDLIIMPSHVLYNTETMHLQQHLVVQ
jgi:hypothetical protein